MVTAQDATFAELVPAQVPPLMLFLILQLKALISKQFQAILLLVCSQYR
jgi:hypothetical protein